MADAPIDDQARKRLSRALGLAPAMAASAARGLPKWALEAYRTWFDGLDSKEESPVVPDLGPVVPPGRFADVDALGRVWAAMHYAMEHPEKQGA